jgi:nitroimidazol reductase NimA-like FMN-containing flavoprotein (pyridoxamine 5'-phosphate oxidase superfamily)
MSGPRLEPTPRTTHRRLRERGTHDRAVVDEVLDEGLLCHVGVLDDGCPVVTPMTYARVGDVVYVHGAPANRTLRRLAEGSPACLTVTLLDGLVLARSAFHHSMNYRSVMLFGTGAEVTEPDEKLAASVALLEHLAPGRGGDARLPDDGELRATLVVRFPIDEGAAKVRTGGPKDDPEDLDLPIWAGQIPLHLTAGPPVPETDLPADTPVPAYAAAYPDRRSSGRGPDRALRRGAPAGP